MKLVVAKVLLRTPILTTRPLNNDIGALAAEGIVTNEGETA